MNPLRVLVVDDVELARQRAVRLLGALPDVEVIGTAADGKEMIAAVAALRPAVLLLDISMPEQDGISALQAIAPAERPQVIFVTAHEQFALSAFRVNAVDYLLKPIEPELLAESLARARQRLGQSHAPAEPSGAPARYPARLTLKVDAGFRIVDVEQINWLQAVRNYVAVHLLKETLFVRSTLQAMLAQLDPQRFAYAHRSVIVNVRKVRELRPFGNGDQRMWLEDGTQLAISRTHREALLERLGR